jgi:BASS family bile acid:Na+ symporter
MTVSMSEINNRSFLPLKSAINPGLYIFLLNYVLFSLISLVLAYFLIEDRELWKGFVIIAASPAGVAIAPFTGILGGDKAFSLKGVIISHLLAMLIIPLYGYLFIGVNFIQPLKLLILFSELIIAPFLISRLLIWFKAAKYIQRFRGPLVNWGLFFVIFTVIALNRTYIFTYPEAAGMISIIAFLSVFGAGIILELILKKSGRYKQIKSSLILFATVKNGGFAAAAAFSLAGERASLPSALVSVIIILYLIYLSFRASSFK